jgi:mannose-6-phosphate isomerase-like protein (cupin superfamily)
MRDQYPRIGAEISIIEASLEQYASLYALQPPVGLQGKIWDTLENLEKERRIDLSDLPVINRFTDHKTWLGAVKSLLPVPIKNERVIHVLRESDKILQMLVVSATDFEDEVHVKEHESFIILEGECECTVGDEVFRLQAGGYTEIPLHTSHDVRIISPYVIAILQRVAV